MARKRLYRIVEVKAGDCFHRLLNGQVSETARVVSVTSDGVGIPHVRFWVHHERTESSDEQRTLALSAFSERFTEPSAA